METTTIKMPESHRKSLAIESELKLLKEIKDFTGFFSPTDLSETMSLLLLDYLNPKGKEDNGQYSGSEIHNMTFTVTSILTFLIKLDSLYDRYIHFNSEKIEEIKHL